MVEDAPASPTESRLFILTFTSGLGTRARGSMSPMAKIRLYFLSVFRTEDEARADFDKNWPRDNELIKRRMELTGKRPEEQYAVAFYNEGRWELYTEVIDYR